MTSWLKLSRNTPRLSALWILVVLNRHPYMMTFYCEIDARRNLTDLIRYAQEKGYRIRDIETTSLTADSFGPAQITLSIYTDGKVDAETLLSELEHVDGVRFIAPI